MANPLGVLMPVIMICACFAQTTDPLIEDFINSLYTTTLKPRSCGVQKQCVPFYRCKVSNSEDFICGYPNTCCDVADKITTTNPTIPVEGPVQLERPAQYEHCGYRSVASKTTGSGDGTDFGEFPWYACLMKTKEASHDNYFCNAAIIGPTAVLTTAACAEAAPTEFIVQPGEWIGKEKTYVQQRARRVDKVIKHESFDLASFAYNLALLIVESAFHWEEHVRPVCLPNSNITFDEARCYFPNWSNQKPKRSVSEGILKRVDAPILPLDQCIEKFRKYSLDFIRIYHFDLCARGKAEKNYDVYDNGAPLVCPVLGVQDQYFLAGISSHSLQKTDANNIGYIPSNIPFAYSSVPLLIEWINDKLTQNGIDLSQLK